MKPRPLTLKREKYVQAVAAGVASEPAAVAAGYRPSYAKVLARRCKNVPEVQSAIASIQAKGREAASYDLAKALADCDLAIAFAIEHKNPMALVKATELKCKLSGLLVDRVEVQTVDLTKALADARGRLRPIVLPAQSDPDESEDERDCRGTA